MLQWRDANYLALNKINLLSLIKKTMCDRHLFLGCSGMQAHPKGCGKQASIPDIKKELYGRKKLRKGQMHIQEMAFMLVAVIIFFSIAGLFVIVILFSQLNAERDTIAMEKTLSAIKNLANSPEFYCVGSKPNCVDSDKAMALMDNENYQKFWPFSRLEILKSSGFMKKDSERIICSLQNYPDCDRIIIYDKNVKNKISSYSYVALCRNVHELGYNYQKCEIAKLIAETELIETKKK